MKYKIVMKKSEEGYSVSCPGLPDAGLKARPKRKPSKTFYLPDRSI